jgi:hypothetical protein
MTGNSASAWTSLAVRRLSCFIAGHLASSVTRPCRRGIEFAENQPFDELTCPDPYLGLDRVEPVVERSTASSVAGCNESGFVIERRVLGVFSPKETVAFREFLSHRGVRGERLLRMLGPLG